MPVLITNNAKTTLGAGISSTDTQVTVATGDGGKFPDPGEGDWFPLTLIKEDGTLEVTKATERSGDSITIERGREGTSAKSFSAGDKVELRLTAGATADIDARARNASNLTEGELPAGRFTDTSHGQKTNGQLHAPANSETAGFMSASDKRKLDKAGTMAERNVTISSSAPSGGDDGDVWFQYV